MIIPNEFVLDASVALAWCFSDEATPKTNALLECLETNLAFVPALWALEIGNVLINCERRGRISYAQVIECLTLLENLKIQIDDEMASRAFHDILPLAHTEKLTTYDTAYLELAMRLSLPLATKDAQLNKVAKKLGVKVLL